MKSLKDSLYELNTRLLYLGLAMRSVRDFASDLTDARTSKESADLFNQLAKAESMIGVCDLIVRETESIHDELSGLELECGKSKTA